MLKTRGFISWNLSNSSSPKKEFPHETPFGRLFISGKPYGDQGIDSDTPNNPQDKLKKKRRP